MKIIFCFLILISFNQFALIDSTLLNQKDSLSNTKDNFLISIKPDTLIPLYNEANYEGSSFISQVKIRNSNYRYFGDILLLNPLVNIRDYGFIGYPNTSSLYGNLQNSVSILKDGLQINERSSNGFNLNLIQTEEIDSVEIIPLPRAALYSSYINPTSINIITKDFLPTEPYSRIKYYQGPGREAFINGYFNAEILKKLFLSFSVTNRIKDETFTNSEFSIWQGNFELKYLLSNQLNIIFSFDLNDYKLGYNGGVDYDSVLKLTTKPDELLYDPIGAPIILPDGQIETYSYSPRLTLKSKLMNWLVSDLNIFYLFTKTQSKTFNYNYYEDKVWGINLKNELSFKIAEIGLILNYEKNRDYMNREIIFDDFISIRNFYYNSIIKTNSDLFSVGSYVTLKPFSKNFSLSLFYKNGLLKEENEVRFLNEQILINHFNNYNNNLKNSAVGIDLNTNLSEKISVYLGYSVIGKYLSQTDLRYLLFESSVKYKDDFAEATLIYFINEFENREYYGNPVFPTFYDYYTFGDLSGISFDLNFNYKFLLLESKTNYFWKSGNEIVYNIPVYTSRNGFYFYDILFNNNLYLKAGLIINFIGNQTSTAFQYNPYKLVSTNPVQTIDFSLSGTIQKSATLYFIWENLLNKKYFLVPYFPMPERNIRFGVSWEFLN